jgi:hypothetical protein
MTMRIDLPLAALFVATFSATLWFSGAFSRPAATAAPTPTLPAMVTAPVASTDAIAPQSSGSVPALPDPAGSLPLSDNSPATLHDLLADPDPETRAEAQALVALLIEENPGY